MSRHSFTKSQRKILEELLDRLERRKIGDRVVSLKVNEDRFPEYFNDSEPEAVKRWEEGVKELVAQDWIEIDPGRGADAHRVARIRLIAEARREVEGALGRMGIEEFRAMLFATGEALMGERPSPPWFERVLRMELDRIGIQWIDPTARGELLTEKETFWKALLFLGRRQGVEAPLGWRQFVVTHFGDSKRLERLRREIVATLAREALAHDSERDEDEASVLSFFGIQSKEEIFLLRGPIQVDAVDASRWRPFLSIPSEMASSGEMSSGAEAILTIENEEPFHLWCRMNPRPDWVVLYLAGFPSRGKLDFLARMARSGTPLYHWGDCDCGGIEIFHFLEKRFRRRITPYRMGAQDLRENDAAARLLSAQEISRLLRLRVKLGEGHVLLPLIDEMLRLGKKLEQEAIHEL